GRGRHVPGDHRAGGDHGTVTNGHPLEHQRAGPDPDVVADGDRRGVRVRLPVHVDGVEVGVQDLHVPGDVATRPDGHARGDQDLAEAVDHRLVADHQLAGVDHDAGAAVQVDLPADDEAGAVSDADHGLVPYRRQPGAADAHAQVPAVAELQPAGVVDHGAGPD